MREYWFKARVYLTARFRSKYWVDEKMLGDRYIISDNVHAAFRQYRELNNRSIYSPVKFSKRYTPIYRDTDKGAEQVGWCVNGLTDIDGKKINVRVWIEVFQRADF